MSIPTSVENMSRDEKSLLLYIETRCADYGGKLDDRQMNAVDLSLLKSWGAEGFVEYGRIASIYVGASSPNTKWCRLSDEAWRLAHECRKARFATSEAQRQWETTAEYRDTQRA